MLPIQAGQAKRETFSNSLTPWVYLENVVADHAVTDVNENTV